MRPNPSWSERAGADKRLPASHLAIMIPDIAHLGLLDDDELELDAAALELAALDHQDQDLSECISLLESLSDRLLVHAVLADESEDQATALAEVFAGEHGFAGDRESYDDPANADLIQVLDRRRGLPIALTILYVAAARRVGWTAHVLNTPGHVLMSVGEDSPVLIDPFNGGVPVQPAQLANLLRATLGRAGAITAEHLAPMTNRAALVRLLTNQATRAETAGDARRALTIYERMTTIAPAYSHGWWELARLHLVYGEATEARQSLSAMLETTRDPALRTHINAALDSLGAG